jgi:DNA-binding response OmpR family regulator
MLSLKAEVAGGDSILSSPRVERPRHMRDGKQTILLIDDDDVVVRGIQRVLSREGYVVDVATSGTEGRRLALEHAYEGILLDLGLGDRPGMTILQELRRAGLTTPILVLTGDGSESSTVRALNAGADAYVVKPVRSQELVARVRALARRQERPSEPQQLAAGTLVLNRLTRQVLVAGAPLLLSPREFGLLEYFMLHLGEVVTREVLLRDVWGTEFDPGTNVVDVHVGRLRRKLVGAGADVQIATRRGEGLALSPL